MRQGWLAVQDPNGTPHLHNNIEERWLTERLTAMQVDEPGMGWHAFRRFRNTWLRGRRCRRTSRSSGWATNLGPCPSCIRTCSRRWSFDLRKAPKWALDSIFLLMLLQTAPKNLCYQTFRSICKRL